MDNGKTEASKVLTTNDIREGARNWTLAGDVGLLAHLEQFSENIFTKTQEIQKRFTELVDDYEELNIKVGNVTNQFLALQNCQFVENRVYDEETPTEEKVEVKVQSQAEQEKLLLLQYKEAVEVGIKLLDTHFQEVQLPPNSDSEDDADDDADEISAGNSVIWKPKNPYAAKKLPLLIGSAEWWADDLVGLGAEEDILDTEKIISESESDMESLKSVDKGLKSFSSSTEHIKSIPTKPTLSDSSNEDLFGLDKNENIKTSASDDFFFRRNSLLDQPDSFLPEFQKEPESDARKTTESASPGDVQSVDGAQEPPSVARSKKVDNAFTRELMAKLSSVTNKKEAGLSEGKKGPEEGRSPAAEVKPHESLFDETDDSSDLFSATINRAAEIPVEKRGLFFDGENDEELFRGEDDLFSGSGAFDSKGSKQTEDRPVVENILEPAKEPEKSPKVEPVAPKKNVVRDLFDDLDDEDMLFASAATETAKPGYKSWISEENSAPKGTKPPVAAPPAWNNEDGLFDGINAEAEDDFFSSSGLFTDSLNKAPAESSRKTHPDLFPEEPQEEKKPDSHFDDSGKSGTLFDSSAADVKKPAEEPLRFSPAKEHSILDSEDDDDDLFSKGTKEKKPALLVSAFPDDEDAALFVDKPKPPDSVSVSSSRSSLFDDMSASKSRLASVFEKDKSNNKTEDDIFTLPGDSLFGDDAKKGKDLFSTRAREERSSLFDDCDDADDLFGAGKPPEETRNHPPPPPKTRAFVGDDDLFKTSAISTALRETKSEIFRQSEGRLFEDDLDDAELFSGKPTAAKPKPPDNLSLKVTETDAKAKSVGKLNIPDNLKLRFESAAKRISSGGPTPPEREKKDEDNKEEVLDEPPRSSSLLKCPSKDRVKIPGRRRPQSRRARQEAIRNSGVWDQPSSVNIHQPSKDSLPSPVASNPLSPSTDEEDFFKVPELDTNFEKEDQSIFKSDLFESKPEESLLFDGAPVLSFLGSRKMEEVGGKPETEVLVKKKKTGSIFDDDEDEDGLGERENLFGRGKVGGGVFSGRSEERVRKSLFDEDSDGEEESLFGGRSEAAVAKPPAVGRAKEGGSEGKRDSSFVDPLGLITKD